MEIIASLLIIITVVAIVLTFYGICLMYDDLAKKSATVGIICAIICIAFSFGIDKKENNEGIQANEVIQEEAQLKTEDIYEPLSGCTAHVAAEIYDQYQNEDGTYSNVFGVDCSEVQRFIWITEQPLPDDVPYLLTMDYKDTLNNPLDDEIVVVWKDMN